MCVCVCVCVYLNPVLYTWTNNKKNLSICWHFFTKEVILEPWGHKEELESLTTHFHTWFLLSQGSELGRLKDPSANQASWTECFSCVAETTVAHGGLTLSRYHWKKISSRELRHRIELLSGWQSRDSGDLYTPCLSAGFDRVWLRVATDTTHKHSQPCVSATHSPAATSWSGVGQWRPVPAMALPCQEKSEQTHILKTPKCISSVFFKL